jgi:hypothetical protein
VTADSGPLSEDRQQRAKQYLRDMFAMNPVWESQQVLIHRRKTLQLPAIVGACSEPADYEEQQRLREQGRERLKAIQSHYFQMPSDKLQDGLRSLSADRHPELAATVSRLTIAANHRESINAMLDDPKYDRDLAIAFGRSLTLAPADAGFAKEQYLRTLSKNRNFSKVLSSIQRIEEINPALFELERDWFAAIRNSKPTWISGSNMRVLAGVGALIAGMIVRFVMYAFETGR